MATLPTSFNNRTPIEFPPLPLDVEPAGTAPSVAVLTLQQSAPDGSISPMVVLNEPLIRRIEQALRGLAGRSDIQGLVLASASPRVFIAGADLKTIQVNPDVSQEEADRALDAYLAYGQRVFGMICDLPYPTCAAIGGAALGGGLELAMHCDGLVGAPNASGKPYPIGLPEAGLGICPGWGGTNLLPARMPDRSAEAIRRTMDGKPLTYDEAVAAGVFDAVAPSPGDLLETAKRWVVEHRSQMGRGDGSRSGGIPRRDGFPARWIGRPGPRVAALAALTELGAADTTESGRAVLEAIRAGLEQGWQPALDVERRELVRLRRTPAGRAAISAFFEKGRK